NIDKSWKNLEVFSIGEGTSRAVKEFGVEVFYEAKNSYGDEFAKEIASFLQNKRVLFPHAKEVVSDVFGILKSLHVNIKEFVVYKTNCVKRDTKEKPEDGSILIFTSPSTVKCFLENFAWNETYKAVAIGKKTANAFPKDIKVNIAPMQTTQSCVLFAQTLSKKSI
ncbi:MAG: uroporphyrinogen-III synthase, partial [Campylobacteraceae bacterium]